jgi:hypothetical protein
MQHDSAGLIRGVHQGLRNGPYLSGTSFPPVHRRIKMLASCRLTTYGLVIVTGMMAKCFFAKTPSARQVKKFPLKTL